jgi:hypothetical protein
VTKAKTTARPALPTASAINQPAAIDDANVFLPINPANQPLPIDWV